METRGSSRGPVPLLVCLLATYTLLFTFFGVCAEDGDLICSMLYSKPGAIEVKTCPTTKPCVNGLP
jgi:hypothetical protein